MVGRGREVVRYPDGDANNPAAEPVVRRWATVNHHRSHATLALYVTRSDTARQFGLVWFGLVWFGLVWFVDI